MNEDTHSKNEPEIVRHVTEIYEAERAASLSPAAARFAETTAVGRREARIARSIASGVADLPRLSVPARLRALVFDRLARPAYRWYHIAAAAVFAGLSPVVVQQAQASGLLVMGDSMLPWVYVSFGVLNAMLVFPVAFYLFANRRRDIEEIERSFDLYLEHPSRWFARFRG